jgi:hypothetical protein
VAVTGAIFNSLNTDRTQEAVGAELGKPISAEQAESLDGALAGASGATQELHKIAGSDVAGVEHALREAFVEALGSSLRLSAALIAVALVLSALLLRKQDPVDGTPLPPVPGAPTPRPATTRL